MRPHVMLRLTVISLMFIAPGAVAQQGAADGEWGSFAGDLGSTKDSPLDQINADNVGSVQVAWTRPLVGASYLAMDEDPRYSNVSSATPLIIA